ncbi:MAG: PTS sugar transporter subunit IIA [Desulfuromonadales bacterium]|uniref:PTS sugar transporter subunit IIA n=1 Tax=Desulfuromonas sp. KJ2020 TaxID=2919173 RepID=UPI0020A7B433|nr:PTS sugar transporter subunit IIA [Desulfuromonas sp. KJ2020]MCP3178077.1 PTS sugar transporter subunit IIA [Desulfuromonas sp. KJ2020]
MVGLVIATHSNLAEEFIRAAEMIIGPVKNVMAICIQQTDSVETIRERIGRAIETVGGDGDGVLVMTDMFGGTPANMAISFLEKDRVDVLTGVNLPMIIKLLNSQESVPFHELGAMLRAYGQQSIYLASDMLS